MVRLAPETSPPLLPVSTKNMRPYYSFPSPTTIKRLLSGVQAISLIGPARVSSKVLRIGRVPQDSQIMTFPASSPEAIQFPFELNRTAVVLLL